MMDVDKDRFFVLHQFSIFLYHVRFRWCFIIIYHYLSWETHRVTTSSSTRNKFEFLVLKNYLSSAKILRVHYEIHHFLISGNFPQGVRCRQQMRKKRKVCKTNIKHGKSIKTQTLGKLHHICFYDSCIVLFSKKLR